MKKLLFDASSVLWQSLYAGKDEESGFAAVDPAKEKQVWVNSAEHGLENFISMFVSTLNRFDAAPKDVVFVCDGENATAFRKAVSPFYKSGRSHAPEQYAEFRKLQGMACALVKELGGATAWQAGMEADDVIAYLARNTRCDITICSNDGDLLALLSDRVHVWTGDKFDHNKYGPFPPQFITLYKALVGDPSDKIKGAAGFGDTRFLNLYATFGDEGLANLDQMAREKRLPELAEDVAEFPDLKKIIDSADEVYKSYELARFYDEKVNAFKTPLDIQPGMVVQWDASKHDERLKQWYGQTEIVYKNQYDNACRAALGKILESPEVFLDIETSSTAESDEWMAQRKKRSVDDGDLGVDVLGHRLTSLQLTFGKNNQFTYYFPVDNAAGPYSENCTVDQVRQFMELIPHSKPIVIQNVDFEMPVLFMEWGEVWKDNPEHGFLVNTLDTKIMASYVDENHPTGLKYRSKLHLGYEQMTYKDLMEKHGVRKMRELTAGQAVGYGCDDTICTAALFNYYRLVMELENTWEAFKQVEVDASYLVSYVTVSGIPFSLERMLELEQDDDEAYDEAWGTLRTYLKKSGWAGTEQPKFDGTVSNIKDLYRIVTSQLKDDEPEEGYKDVVLSSRIRIPAKLVALIEEAQPAFAGVLYAGLNGDSEVVDEYVRKFFKGEVKPPLGSPKQMRHLMYEVMGLPVRLRNKPTDKMRENGVYEGTAQTDDLAIQYALIHDQDKGPEVMAVLKAIQVMQIVSTRRKLYYVPYRDLLHWSDGRLHPSLMQSAAVTRRFTPGGPNVNQWAKHPKANGETPKFRECVVPHKRGAVIFPPDFSGQELRVIAEYSQDENMLACFIGDNKKDMHALTATGIATRIGARPEANARWLDYLPAGSGFSLAELAECTYEDFEAIRKDKRELLNPLFDKGLRPLGKKTNFTTEYGAMAPKLARTLIISEEEAQQYIDAKLEAFPGAEAWKKRVIEELHETGYTTTMMGARRHLAAKLLSGQGYEIGKAERQGVNFKVQSSSAEMTKMAMGRIWRSGILFRYDCEFYLPCHDELVFSIVADDQAPEFIREVNALMTAQYANMRVPIIASISVGRNYGPESQIECGDEFELRAVQEGLNKALGREALKEAA